MSIRNVKWMECDYAGCDNRLLLSPVGTQPFLEAQGNGWSHEEDEKGHMIDLCPNHKTKGQQVYGTRPETATDGKRVWLAFVNAHDDLPHLAENLEDANAYLDEPMARSSGFIREAILLGRVK